MASNHQRGTFDGEGEEEDLELLRLAALQSLRKPTSTTTPPTTIRDHSNVSSGARELRPHDRHHRKAFINRMNRNNVRNRNPNLIAVQTVDDFAVGAHARDDDHRCKLMLPQDRYATTNTRSNHVVARVRNGASVGEVNSTSTGSKFDRYKDSEESESESDSECDLKLAKKTNSLEDLMQELENEIQASGEKKPEEEVVERDNGVVERREKEVDRDLVADRKEVVAVEEDNKVVEEGALQVKPERVRKPVKRHYRAEKRVVANGEGKKRHVRFHAHAPPPLSASALPPPTDVLFPHYTTNHPVFSTGAPLLFNPTNAYEVSNAHQWPPTDNTIYRSTHVNYDFGTHLPTAPPHPQLMAQQQQQQQAPPPPLMINTSILNTINAPLSPRSAAFVLQNRAIIERRKKSPTIAYRSRSRSLSPPPPAAATPPLLTTPPTLSARSTTPPTPPPHSHTAKQREHTSSTKKKRTCSNRHTSPRGHKRLLRGDNDGHEVAVGGGASPRKERTRESVRARMDEKEVEEEETPIVRLPLDRVLEVRRQKFEKRTVPLRGTIKLRAVEEEGGSEGCTEVRSRDVNNSHVDYAISLSLDGEELLFSDSDEANGLKPETTASGGGELRLRNNGNGGGGGRLCGSIERDSKRRSHRNGEEPPPASSSSSSSPQKRVPSTAATSPSKLARKRVTEKGSSNKATSSNGEERKTVSSRKIQVCTPGATQSLSPTRKDTIKVEETGGDLRAQLSRKRAQRQRISPKAIQSRLLHNALEDVLRKCESRGETKQRDDESISLAGKKVPIRLRLGMMPNEVKAKRKTRTAKSKGSRKRSTKQEQSIKDQANNKSRC